MYFNFQLYIRTNYLVVHTKCTYVHLTGERNPVVNLHVVKIPAHPESLPVSPATFGIGIALTASTLINCVTAFTSTTEARTERPRTVSTGSTDIVRMQLTAPTPAMTPRPFTPLNTPCPTPSIVPIPDTDSDSEQTVHGPCKEASVVQCDVKGTGHGLGTGTGTGLGQGKGKEGGKEGQGQGQGQGEGGKETGTGLGGEVEIEMEMNAPLCDDYYLARVGWFPDGSVMAQVQNREQSVLQLLRLDPHTGKKQK